MGGLTVTIYFACTIIFGLLTIQRQHHLPTLTFKFPSASPAPVPDLSNFHFPCGGFSRAPPLLKIPSNTCNLMIRIFGSNKRHASGHIYARKANSTPKSPFSKRPKFTLIFPRILGTLSPSPGEGGGGGGGGACSHDPFPMSHLFLFYPLFSINKTTCSLKGFCSCSLYPENFALFP